MDSTHFTVTLVDGEGTPIEPSQNAHRHPRRNRPGQRHLVYGRGVELSGPPGKPEGSAVMLGLRHYKQKEKKVSLDAGPSLEKESIRQEVIRSSATSWLADRSGASQALQRSNR